ncbi:hypothetical protein BDR03DRAFT_864209 [Suillus americanus]|nr:hypothetical protein BDR03DRAFT_864209 [Suillus americanus]
MVQYSNLTTVIPAMDHIDESLTTHSFNKNLNSAIHAALAMGKKTLDRYYSLTNSSQTYHIAMGKFSFTLWCSLY